MTSLIYYKMNKEKYKYIDPNLLVLKFEFQNIVTTGTCSFDGEVDEF